MKYQYRKWIDENVSDPYNACREATEEMAAAFPDLERVRGHYHCPDLGKRPHWWLLDPNGVIVDPTADQFPSGGSGAYEAWDESQPEPTGKCPNCGDYSYGSQYFCS